MTFYSELAAMAADLLKPDSENGLGQGAIQIVRLTPGTPNPAAPHNPVAPTEAVATVDQIGNPRAEYTDRGTVIKTDVAYMITPPSSFSPAPGDVVRIGGKDYATVVHVERLGALDVPVYWKVFCNR